MNKHTINLIIESSGKTIKQFAKELGINSNSIKKWLSGETKPSLTNQTIIRLKFKREIAKLYK
jgi:DNA-binding transcriptional regulator YiaG